jgi:type VI secretion system secreted protein VgrG
MSRLQATQANYPFIVTTPLADDKLLFYRMTGTEQLGRLFDYELELLSNDADIKLEDILGGNITVRSHGHAGQSRFFNGYVTRFSLVGMHGEYYLYQASVRPWLWFLTRTSDCKIFQEMSAPDIIKEVFRLNGFSDFEEVLSKSYHEWNYCVQYRETDFNFISRLMEQEGIYYYFKHEESKHTLVITDSISGHEAIPGYESVPYYPPEETDRRERDYISSWMVSQEIQPGAYALNDFDFEKPKASLEVKSMIKRKHEQAGFEVYDYPGEYIETGVGENYVRTRIEELQAQYELVHGSGNVAGLSTGCLFKLTNYPREDQKREYLLVSAEYDLGPQEYESRGSGQDGYFNCTFRAMDSQQSFRTARTTPKPMVQGPQTAMVVGKSGEEIWTDKYGRVKVQFHWDRYGKSDENSSCWVRVAQVWAGKTWGAVHTPRMGQEVIVEFLEGDPDRPIITGRIYNADNMPPYELPTNKTQSGIKSRSSKGGSGDNFNEIRFEDKKGEELLSVHAEKDQSISVENDETHSVGHDRSKDVGNDEQSDIGNDRTETVGKNESITIGENRDESVGKNESISIGSNQSISVGGNRDASVGKNESTTVSADRSLTVSKSESVSIGKDETLSIGENRSQDIGKDDLLNVGKKLAMVAGDEIILKTGSASIVMKKNGDITIKGKNITMNGSGKITVKASSDVTIKGSKIKQN